MAKHTLTPEEYWHTLLTSGFEPGQRAMRALFRRLPKNPRCRLCYSPFDGIGGVVMRSLLNRTRSNYNPLICNACELYAEKYPGGTEIDLAFLFADVRGSTALSEKLGNAEFSRLIDRFFSVSTDVLARSDSFIEKMMGDEVTGLYFPGLAGAGYVRRAVDAALELIKLTEGWIPVGVGVHSGRAYFGSVGKKEGIRNLTVLGEAANMGARLASKAGPGEVLVSEPAALAAGLEIQAYEHRELELKGLSGAVGAWVL